MASDRYCIVCGVDMRRSYDPPIRCELCEVAEGYEAKLANALAKVKRLQAALDAATRPSKPLAGVSFGAWEPCDNGTARFDLRVGPPASRAALVLGVGVGAMSLPVVTWVIVGQGGDTLDAGTALSVSVALGNMCERARELGWEVTDGD